MSSTFRAPLIQTLARLEEARAALEGDERTGVSEYPEETNSDNTTDDGPLSISTLKENLGIVRGDHLAFRTSILNTFERGRIESAAQGGDEYMTSRQMYQHLDVIQSSVPGNVSGHQWVNTILLRVSAMVSSQTEGMVFKSDDTTRPINHTVVLASNTYKPFLLSLPSAFTERRLKRLLVVEAPPGVDSLPQAVREMYSAAVSLKQKIIRGALTDGFTWTFIILRTLGGAYSCSVPFRIPHEGLYPFRVGPSPVEADVVTGILAHWLQHSLEDIDQCDEKEWFQRFGDDGVPVGSTCP